jgi:hypothetical protein
LQETAREHAIVSGDSVDRLDFVWPAGKEYGRAAALTFHLETALMYGSSKFSWTQGGSHA